MVSVGPWCRGTDPGVGVEPLVGEVDEQLLQLLGNEGELVLARGPLERDRQPLLEQLKEVQDQVEVVPEDHTQVGRRPHTLQVPPDPLQWQLKPFYTVDLTTFLYGHL